MERIDMFDYLEYIKAFVELWNNNSNDIEAFTSGSTGLPKRILLPRQLVYESAWRSILHFGLSKDSVIHLILSPEYIAGKMAIIRALEVGCKLTYEPPSSTPLSLTSTPNSITLLSAVGAQLEGMTMLKQAKRLPAIKHLLLGGAPLTNDMRKAAVDLAENVWESYGMTETASHIALRQIDKTAPTSRIAFKPLKGISVSTDKRGCLVIDMPTVGRLVTNDLAELTGSGDFFILGRIDNVIISGGLKVIPEKAEELLSQYLPEQIAFYVSSRPHAKWGEEVVLMIENNDIEHSKEISPSQYLTSEGSFEELCRSIMPPHYRPKAVIETPYFERTSSGKLIRRKVKD